MDTRRLAKYVKMYLTLFKYSFIQTTAYRVSFLFQLGVELGYQVVLVVFFVVIFGNVHTIGGWTYYQVLFLTGLNIIASELIIGSIFIDGLRDLPRAIKDGDIDVALLKPVNALFTLSLSRPYFASMLGAIPGFGLMVYAAIRMGLPFSLLSVLLGLLLFLCGLVIGYAISVICASLSFYFISANSLPQLAEKVITNYKANPSDVYQGVLRILFFFVIPIVFISSIPAAAVVRSISLFDAILAPLLAAILLWLAIKTWNIMIKHYSSASS